MNLAEKYRPACWAELIGQSRLVETIDRLRPRSLGGRAYFIAGPSGAGKTSAARLLAAELADPLNVVELDASECTAARLRDIAESFATYGLGVKVGRVCILNECHGLRRDAIRYLLTALESIPPHCAWIFTTTADGEGQLFEEQIDAGPFVGRCIELRVTTQGLAQPAAERLKAGAQAEGLDGKELAQYVRLVHACKGSIRRAWQKIESGAMLG